MSTKKLTPPANAPKIPKGWVYRGNAWKSDKSVRYAFWGDGLDWDTWSGLPSGHEGPTLGFEDRHYITPIKRPAKKPAIAKPKIPAHVLKNARELAEMGRVAREKALAKGKAKGYKFTLYVDGASSKESAKTAVLVAFAKRGPDGCVFHLRTTSAIGVAGGKGAKK